MTSDYQRIAAVIRYLEEHADEQPSLEELGERFAQSPFSLQKLFTRWAGVSPKKFLQYLTVGHARKLLREALSVLDTSLEVGLSGPGRLHDLFVTVEGVTPGEYKHFGAGLEIRYGFHDTPFGLCLAAVTARGLCWLSFVDDDARGQALIELQDHWAQATLVDDPQASYAVIKQIFLPDEAGVDPLRLLLKGTAFQLKVWEALLRIPEGRVVSYHAVAESLDCPKASRAVGSAIGSNPIAYLIPCHRVLRGNGELGGYRWGTVRKRAMLMKELLKDRGCAP